MYYLLQHFDAIGYVSASQQPRLLTLQRRLHAQLHPAGDPMPKKARETTEQQVAQLRRVARGRTVCIVVDDLWQREHCDAFDVLDEDEANASRLLVTVS